MFSLNNRPKQTTDWQFIELCLAIYKEPIFFIVRKCILASEVITIAILTVQCYVNRRSNKINQYHCKILQLIDKIKMFEHFKFNNNMM
jgi:hypothetical protein